MRKCRTCGVPAGAQAYSLNFTAVPNGPLAFLSTWPTGQSLPLVSTLNAPTGAVTANAAIVPAGTNGSIDLYVYNSADVIVDINGHFAAPGVGGLSLYSVTPCRISDSRYPAATHAHLAGDQQCMRHPVRREGVYPERDPASPSNDASVAIAATSNR